MTGIDTRVAEWRTAILRSRAVDEGDADELEGHLREQVADLQSAGLSEEEAFLIAVRRLGEVDRLTAEYAREHGDRLWKQLVIAPPQPSTRRPFLLMLGFAAAAAVAIQVGRLLALGPSDLFVFGDPTAPWFVRNLGLFVLPFLAAYFAVARRMPARRALVLLAVLAVVAVAVNLFPFPFGSDTDALVGLHLPVLLWFVVGVAYLGGEVRSSAGRMEFIRFTGEWAIYYALIALGGAVLLGLTTAILAPIAPDAIEGVITWVLPSGASAAVIVAGWLVEAKKSVIENLAPVLTAIFTPLFAAMLVVAVVVYGVGGLGMEFDRDLLTVFDVLLLVVLGLVVYGISARPADRDAGPMDVVRLVAVAAAVLLDALVLGSMLLRVGEYGFTPNRFVALGLNVLLLVNLAVTAWLLLRLLMGRRPAVRLERWQTGYLAAFAAWVLAVVLLLPPVFGFR